MMGFLDSHFQRTNEEASAVAQDLRRQGHERDIKIATWILVGNGVALLSVFNAAINRDLCEWAIIQPYAGAFLLGVVSAAASVIFDGAADDRGAARLIILMSAARRASICIDSNNTFREWLAKNPEEPSEDVRRQVAENDATIEEARSLLQTKSEEPCVEKLLRGAARASLALGALCFGGALFVAVNSGSVTAAVCP